MDVTRAGLCVVTSITSYQLSAIDCQRTITTLGKKGVFRVPQETRTVPRGGLLTTRYFITSHVKSGRLWTVTTVTIRYVCWWLAVACKRSRFIKRCSDITFAPFHDSEYLICNIYLSLLPPCKDASTYMPHDETRCAIINFFVRGRDHTAQLYVTLMFFVIVTLFWLFLFRTILIGGLITDDARKHILLLEESCSSIVTPQILCFTYSAFYLLVYFAAVPNKCRYQRWSIAH